MTAPKWITEKDVAEMTGRAVQTLRNDRCKCKGIPYSKIGASIRYKVEDVVSFMEGHRIIPKKEGLTQ
ncbi:MAG: helix-turn-helix domain-containing protein [Candidatus Electrothrix sp. GW3-4]|uniref:helix-turn-helix domain-containing protein n=1 Tax=Candidatus Electrothrix sp. GW3-4 TaxID=3126740 RepID=UPI0030D2230F